MLLLSYCINIVFYLLLKAEGKPVRDHPVVLRLVEIRTFLEKARPIDKKLAYQIEKLLKLASAPAAGTGGGRAGAAAAEAEEEDGGAGADPLAFRPNIGALVAKGDGRGRAAAGDGGEAGAGVYRPPKMVPMAMEEAR